MATLTLDTHKAISLLKEAGFEEAKAEAVVDIFQEVDLNHLVSKEDLRAPTRPAQSFLNPTRQLPLGRK